MGALQQALLGAGSAAEFTPSDLADIWEWWEPSRQGLVDTDPMEQFTGQANARHMPKINDATRPIFTANQINGLGAARFDAGKGLQIPNMSALTESHFFLVIIIDADPPASGFGGLHSNGTSGTTSHYCFTDDSIYEGWGTSARLTAGNPVPALTSWRVYEVISVSGTFTVKIDGTDLPNSPRASNTVAFPNDATHLFGRDAGSNYTNGYVAGIYQFSAQLSAGDRTDLIDYINNRFGLSST